MAHQPEPEDFRVTSLGQGQYSAHAVDGLAHLVQADLFTDERERVPNAVSFREGEAVDHGRAFEKAGPRRLLYFNPQKVRAGIVTCGGICPGLNDVIRALFMTLRHTYGVRDVLGFRYGFRGLDPSFGLEPILFDHDMVYDLMVHGGTVLGTARGQIAPEVMLETLRAHRIDMLFVIGGDGSHRGAHAIAETARAQGYDLAVVGVPKTIDNDINYVSRTFGFDTAVEFARNALDAAGIEAQGNPGGVGLVKVMGRDSGFIAAYATLASNHVNIALVPEVPFELEGPHGLLAYLKSRLQRPHAARRRAVIVVAEGAGQELLAGQQRGFDASGNKLHSDIGLYLKDRIQAAMTADGIEVNIKYIDPSYMLRAQRTNASDSILAADLGRMAVHAAMAGKTDVMIGLRYDHYIHVPIPLAVATRKKIDPKGSLWRRVIMATGQPALVAP